MHTAAQCNLRVLHKTYTAQSVPNHLQVLCGRLACMPAWAGILSITNSIARIASFTLLYFWVNAHADACTAALLVFCARRETYVGVGTKTPRATSYYQISDFSGQLVLLRQKSKLSYHEAQAGAREQQQQCVSNII